MPAKSDIIKGMMFFFLGLFMALAPHVLSGEIKLW